MSSPPRPVKLDLNFDKLNQKGSFSTASQSHANISSNINPIRPNNLASITPILPPSEIELDFDLCHTIVEAIQVYEMKPNSQSQIQILDDQEVNRPVLELTGKANIAFPCRSFFHLLCLYIKATGSFFSIKITIVDDTRVQREFKVSNHISKVRIVPTHSDIPMCPQSGWQMSQIDLQEFCQKCYGTNYSYVQEVVFEGGIKIYRAFMSEKEYSDAELPPYLRVISVLPNEYD